MRGKARLSGSCRVRVRITPAYAGKSIIALKRFTGNWDHPRLCGEKGILRRTRKGRIGSPPPMRGKDLELDFYKSGNGITPAYAGKSLNSTLILFMIKDHPRLCGEKSAIQR